MLELIVISTLNGVLYGMLLFLMASGLTVIFSMLGVLNFAHASFYMLGAFFGFQISRWFGFWPALLIAPLLAGPSAPPSSATACAVSTRTATSRNCCSPSVLHLRSRKSCRSSGARARWTIRVPPLLDFPAFTIFSTNYPAYKMFMLLVSVAIFLGAADRVEEDADRA